jgi:hypothetical protein
LFAKPDFVVLENGDGDPGENFFVRAKGFSSVDAFSMVGNDVASMLDSPGGDTFIGTPEWSSMEGVDEPFVYSNKATGFKEVYAYALYGGDDTAELNYRPILDSVTSGPDWLRIEAIDSSYLVEAHLFETANALPIALPAAAPASELDYFYFVEGSDSSDDSDDEADVDPSAADWLVTAGWD